MIAYCPLHQFMVLLHQDPKTSDLRTHRFTTLISKILQHLVTVRTVSILLLLILVPELIEHLVYFLIPQFLEGFVSNSLTMEFSWILTVL